MKRNTTKTKLVATIVSMVSALCLLAVGVFATLTNFQVAIANQLNLKFDAVEGTLYATRLGDVAGTDRTTSKVLSESTTATDWLKVYDGTTTEGIQNDALTSIQEKVDFISNDKIKEKVNAGTTSIAITYYFYYTLPTDAVANSVALSAPAVTDSNVAVSYSYIKATSSTLPDFTGGTALINGATVQVSGGEHLFIKAEAKVDLSKSVKIENADWSFTLNFGISQYSLNGDILTFNAVSGAETYEVWAKQTTTSGASLLAQTSAVGDTDATLGTLVKILDSATTNFDLSTALGSLESGDYKVAIVPKNTSGVEISGNSITLVYQHTKKLKITFSNKILESGDEDYNYYGLYAISDEPLYVEAGYTWRQLVEKYNIKIEFRNVGACFINGTETSGTPHTEQILADVLSVTYECRYYDYSSKSYKTSTHAHDLTRYYCGLDFDAVINNDTNIQLGIHSWECFSANTEIWVYDENEKKYKKKKITEITYDDNVVCWDFDNGKLTTAKPIWIKKPQKASNIYRLTYSNGSYVDVVGGHGVFSAEDGKFAGSPKEYKLGTTNFTHNGEDITLVKIEHLNYETTSHTIVTGYHMNCFTNDILTSILYSNIYPIKDKKYVKDNRKIRAFEEFDVPREYYDGFRLGEQQEKSIKRINETVNTTFVKGKLEIK